MNTAFHTSISSYQRVELNGRTYDVVLYANGNARAAVVTKRGPRTLNGHGRAYRFEIADAVITLARQQAAEARS